MYEKLYGDITDSLVKNGYVVIENIFTKALLASLLTFAKDEQKYKKAGISSSNTLHLDNSKRSDKTLWLDEDGATQSEYFEFSNGLQKYLNRSLYLGLFYNEAHFSIYGLGDFYEKHLDAFRGEKNRVVTTVYYLNEDWRKSDGGELLIYDEDDMLIKTVIPNGNTLVVFLSDKFPHEVLKTKVKRYSIAGWFRIDRK